MRFQEGIVLLRRNARQGLEPMTEMCGAPLDSPLLHCPRNNVSGFDLEFAIALLDTDDLLIGFLRKHFLHDRE